MSDIRDQLWRAAVQGNSPTVSGESLSVDQGQALQLELLEKWLAQGERVAGYKVGLTSGKARDAFGPGVRPFGYVLNSRILQSGEMFEVPKGATCGLENELVFRIDQDLPPREITADDMRRAAASVAPGFELNQHRLTADATSGLRVADNLSQYGMVVGEFTAAESIDLANLEVQLFLDDQVVETTQARDHIDDHYRSLATLANRLRSFSRELVAGDLVITGSFTRQAITRSATWRGVFKSLGEVVVRVIS